MDAGNAQIWIETGLEYGVQYGMSVIQVIFIFIVGKWLAGKLSKVAVNAMERGKVDTTIAHFGGTIIRYLILTVTVMAILNVFNVETTSLVAVLGAAGFAVGLAMQGTLSNFSSGVMLLLFRPFSIGDVIEAAGVTGMVQKLGIFSTVLMTPDQIKITVPNGQIYGGTIKNMTGPDKLRFVMVDVGVAYDGDVDQAKAVLETMLRAVPGVLPDKPVSAYLLGLGASSVDFSLRTFCWDADFWDVREAMLRGAKYALAEADIGIPYQTLDINIVGSVNAPT